MSNINVVNPGLVNVSDQAQSPIALTQTITVGPSDNSGGTSQGAGYAPGKGVANATSEVTPPMTAGRTVQAGSASPLALNVISTNMNTVIGQQFGSSTSENVYV